MKQSFTLSYIRFGKVFVALVLICVLFVPLKPTSAGTASGTIAVTATVIAACLLGTSALPFGNYDPTSSTATTASTTITATCTNAAPYTIALNNGVGTGGDATAGAQGRKMTLTSGSTLLGYNLYTDSAFTNYWATTGAHLLSATGTGVQQSYTLYGRVPAQQTATAGSYADTVTATLSF